MALPSHAATEPANECCEKRKHVLKRLYLTDVQEHSHENQEPHYTTDKRSQKSCMLPLTIILGQLNQAPSLICR